MDPQAFKLLTEDIQYIKNKVDDLVEFKHRLYGIISVVAVLASAASSIFFQLFLQR